LFLKKIITPSKNDLTYPFKGSRSAAGRSIQLGDLPKADLWAAEISEKKRRKFLIVPPCDPCWLCGSLVILN